MAEQELLTTPLTAHGCTRLSSSGEMRAFLSRLVACTAEARLWPLGFSAGGRPLTALHLRALRDDAPLLRVLLVGSQHGASEAAGGEALLELARLLSAGELSALRAHIEFVIHADANPDGRDADSSRNAEDININRDFVLLTQPETRALDRLLLEFAPHVVLDAHESAVLKRQSLARQGYMTDFETQFDCGNNPAIPDALRGFMEDVMLPALLQRVSARGVRATRYIREITSLSQALTHGGLTVRKFRNRAAVGGALAFLLETRRDPQDGVYDSFRNIAVRSAKQLLAQRVFVDLLAEMRAPILKLLTSHAASREAVVLDACYVPTAADAMLRVPLRAIADGALADFEFADHRRVVAGAPVALAARYWITAHHATFARLLDAHGFAHRRLDAALRRAVLVQPVAGAAHTWPAPHQAQRWLAAGTLEVPVSGARARLLPLLLEPLSGSSVFRYAAFAGLLPAGADCFVLRDAE